MRILYIDIDTLRPDHLGCYGYHRQTSPNIDAFAKAAAVFENVHASDVPCLPSRTALLTGRFGFHNGVVNHGGTDADPVIDGASREFWSRLQLESFPTQLANGGAPFRPNKDNMRTVSISSFAQRHSAFHWYAGFDEAYNVGKFGLETADEVYAIAEDWLTRNGAKDNWFLHVHMWDPHTPYRTPKNSGSHSLMNRFRAGIPRRFVSSIGTVVARIQPVSAMGLRRILGWQPYSPPASAGA